MPVTNGEDPASVRSGERDVSAISRATAALLHAVNRSDVSGVLRGWTDDGVMMPPHHPPVRGRAEMERYFAQLFSRSRFRFSFTSSRLEVSGDVAFELVEYTVAAFPAEGGPEVRDSGKGLHLFRRMPDGSWRLAVDIWNNPNVRR